MIELRHNQLHFLFPEVHPQAKLTIEFQRTLRIPDDASDYALPPGLGRFPLCHVDDHAANLPEAWIRHGGVMLPMYQSEAMWLNFDGQTVTDRQVEYPFAVKVATGKLNAVTGRPWSSSLSRAVQNYLVIPGQPWLDGYCVEPGVIRQFVAMPLGSGYSTEEQLTESAEFGGIQLSVCPMKRTIFERRFPRREAARFAKDDMCYQLFAEPATMDMGLAPGGRMRQEVYEDPFDFDDWDQQHASRCFVHIANSLVWRAVTGRRPPTTPPTAREYTAAGLPWFEYYDETATALSGGEKLKGTKSVAEIGTEKGDVPLPENKSVVTENVVSLKARKLKPGQVREGVF